jgi:hypothetical protein
LRRRLIERGDHLRLYRFSPSDSNDGQGVLDKVKDAVT